MVGRNDACPCGSGKKYKKCCLRKEKVIQLIHLKTEQYFQQKFQLTMRFQEHLYPQTFQEDRKWQQVFHRRSKTKLPKPFFDFWCFFFRQDEEGKRGIERYNERWGKNDPPALREMALRWEQLEPRLIQQVDDDEQGVIVEDAYTGERLYLPYCETIQKCIPWAGALCLLDIMNGQYYITGVASFVSPFQFQKAKDFVDREMREQQMSLTEVLFKRYPEIQGILNEDILQSDEETSIQIIRQSYYIHDLTALKKSMTSIPYIDLSEEDDVVVGNLWKNMYRYDDTAAKGPIMIGELYGTFEINDNHCTFQTLDEEGAILFQQLMALLPQASFLDTDVEEMKVSGYVQSHNCKISMSQEEDEAFLFITQQTLMLEDLEQPLMFYGGQSVKTLWQAGEQATVERYFQQEEYLYHMQQLSDKGVVNVTPDFNRLRSKLGLPLSPFVSMKEIRQTSFASMFRQTLKEFFETEKLITPQTSVNFFKEDLLVFLEEVSRGKSEQTYKKYEKNVTIIYHYLSGQDCRSWKEMTAVHWENLLVSLFTKDDQPVSKTQVNNFFTTLRAFTKWLDQKYETAHFESVRSLKEEVPHILQTINQQENLSAFAFSK